MRPIFEWALLLIGLFIFGAGSLHAFLDHRRVVLSKVVGYWLVYMAMAAGFIIAGTILVTMLGILWD